MGAKTGTGSTDCVMVLKCLPSQTTVTQHAYWEHL